MKKTLIMGVMLFIVLVFMMGCKKTGTEEKDLKKIDAFKDLEIKYSGISPHLNATATTKSDNKLLKKGEYVVKPAENLKIGDKVIVRFRCSDDEMKETGYQPKETKKEYTIDKADSYVEDCNEIDDGTIEKMKKQGEDIIEAKFANNGYGSYLALDFQPRGKGLNIVHEDVESVKISCELQRCYLMVRKDLADREDQDNNAVIMTYKVDFKDINYPEGETIYIIVHFDNVKKLGTGEIDVDITKGALGNAFSKEFFEKNNRDEEHYKFTERKIK